MSVFALRCLHCGVRQEVEVAADVLARMPTGAKRLGVARSVGWLDPETCGSCMQAQELRELVTKIWEVAGKALGTPPGGSFDFMGMALEEIQGRAWAVLRDHSRQVPVVLMPVHTTKESNHPVAVHALADAVEYVAARINARLACVTFDSFSSRIEADSAFEIRARHAPAPEQAALYPDCYGDLLLHVGAELQKRHQDRVHKLAGRPWRGAVVDELPGEGGGDE